MAQRAKGGYSGELNEMLHEIRHLPEDNRMLLAKSHQQPMDGLLMLQRHHFLV
jgi:hypothetical protein